MLDFERQRLEELKGCIEGWLKNDNVITRTKIDISETAYLDGNGKLQRRAMNEMTWTVKVTFIQDGEELRKKIFNPIVVTK